MVLWSALLLGACLALAARAAAAKRCGECDANAHCEYSVVFGEHCVCDRGFSGSGAAGGCREDAAAQLYDLCHAGGRCCADPLGSTAVTSRRDCEAACDAHPGCKYVAFDASGGGCHLFGSCSARTHGGPWELRARNGSASCPASAGCRADLRITATHASVRRGNSVTLRATVRLADTNKPARNMRITFAVRGTAAGSATTDRQGVATVRFRYPAGFPKGRQSYTAAHAGSSSYNA